MKSEELNDYIFAEIVSRYVAAVRILLERKKYCQAALQEIEASGNNSI